MEAGLTLFKQTPTLMVFMEETENDIKDEKQTVLQSLFCDRACIYPGHDLYPLFSPGRKTRSD